MRRPLRLLVLVAVASLATGLLAAMSTNSPNATRVVHKPSANHIQAPNAHAGKSLQPPVVVKAPTAPERKASSAHIQLMSQMQSAPLEEDGRCAKTTFVPTQGNVCRTRDGLFRIVHRDGSSSLTHGPEAPALFNTWDDKTDPRVAWAVAHATKADVACVNPSTSGYYNLVYAIPADRPNNSATIVPQLRQTAYEVSAFLDAESRRVSAHERTRLKFVCDASGQPVVSTVQLATSMASTTFNSIYNELLAAGKMDAMNLLTNKRAMVLWDGTGGVGGAAGQAQLNMDDRNAADNRNNYGGLMAVSYSPTPDWQVFAHELGHNLGAVQKTAPHSDSQGHCSEEVDVMCYSPGHLGCTKFVFDCNNDDYFNPAPYYGTYIASHWNIASKLNRFVARSTDSVIDAISPAIAGYGFLGSKFWFVSPNGAVTTSGGAVSYGDLALKTLPAAVVDIQPTSTGQGYLIALANGAVYSFGDAPAIGGLPQAGINPSSKIGGIKYIWGDGYTLKRNDGADYSISSYQDCSGVGGTPTQSAPVTQVPAPVQPASGGVGGASGNALNTTVQMMTLSAATGKPPAPTSTPPSLDPSTCSTVTTASLIPNAGQYRVPGGAIPVTGASTADQNGFYWVTSNGAVYTYGSANYYGGANTLTSVPQNIVAITPTLTGDGYWLLGSDGGVFSFGDAKFYGSMPGIWHKSSSPMWYMWSGGSVKGTYRTDAYTMCNHANMCYVFAPGVTPYGVVPNLPHPGLDGTAVKSISSFSKWGFYTVTTKGAVYSYGDAVYRGGSNSLTLNKPISSMALNPAGTGYWLVGQDGGVFSYNATFRGSLVGYKDFTPAAPITNILAYGDGYKLVASNRSYIFTSTVKPTNLLTPPPMPGYNKNGVYSVDAWKTKTGNGYWTVTSTGAVHSFGDATYHGGATGITLNKPISAIVSNTTDTGYWLVAQDGGVFSYGARYWGSLPCIHITPNQPVKDAKRWGSGGYVLISPADGGQFHFDATTHYCGT